MELDPLLKELIKQASKDFDLPEDIFIEIIVEEKLRRYQRGGERRFLDDKIMAILEEYFSK